MRLLTRLYGMHLAHACMYASVYGDGHVELTYVTAHTNQPGPSEDAYLPSTREEIALNLANGIPPERIMEGINIILLP